MTPKNPIEEQTTDLWRAIAYQKSGTDDERSSALQTIIRIAIYAEGNVQTSAKDFLLNEFSLSIHLETVASNQNQQD